MFTRAQFVSANAPSFFAPRAISTAWSKSTLRTVRDGQNGMSLRE
jgi:hypothetical protein